MHTGAAWVTIIGQNVVVTFRNAPKYTLPHNCAATCSLVCSQQGLFLFVTARCTHVGHCT